jgi:hypothetical protein
MTYKISQERLNEICFPILDEVYGVLTTKDKIHFYDENGQGRIYIRRKEPHIYFKDYKKLISELELNTHIWGLVLKNWIKENFNIKVEGEFSWLTWSI